MMKEILYIENVVDEKSSQVSEAISLATTKGLGLSVLFVVPLHPDVTDWVDVQEKQLDEAEANVESLGKKLESELKEKGQPFKWKMIRGTGDAMLESIGEFMPADVMLVGKLDLEPLGEKGVHNLEDLSSRFHCPVLPVERLLAGSEVKQKNNIVRFLSFGVLSAASYFLFFPQLDRLNHALFMKGTILGGLAVMAVVGIHAYVYGSFTEYIPKFLGLEKPGGGGH
ncbi:MAG: hypothetical protein JRI36_11610 [Deltaproteobacteria bacterium]|nr:hypothetical protein [Deltaproteobacteria bacterium]